jgi:rhodanese-related sulfurtransferase
VRRPGFGTPYAHWILFLGVEGDKARIVDPPHAVQLLPFAELLALWDGTGLIVAKEPVNSWTLRVSAWLELGSVLLFGATVMGLARLVLERNARRRHPLVGLAILPAMAVGLAVAVHVISDEGFFHNRAALAQVIGGHFKPQLPALSVEEVAKAIHDPKVAFVDARLPRDYQQGHIPGAINLPVHSGLVERSETLARINPTNRVIVYCQSDRCPWGEVIASDLYYRGYRRTCVFPGGWKAWVRYERSRSQP